MVAPYVPVVPAALWRYRQASTPPPPPRDTHTHAHAHTRTAIRCIAMEIRSADSARDLSRYGRQIGARDLDFEEGACL
eukprot:39167-Rhodomonas_salina.3